METVPATIDPNDQNAIREARIPTFDTGNELKVKYLSYRAVGFTFKESCHLAEVKADVVRGWRRTDADFKSFEKTDLRPLQKEAAKDILETEFKRNILMLVRKDARIIEKSMQSFNTEDNGTVDGMELFTEREFEYFKAIRRFYTPDQLLQLSKALEPDKFGENKVVVLSFNGGDVSLPEYSDQPGYSIEVTE